MQVAERLIFMHEECVDRNFSSIERLRQSPRPQVAHAHVNQVAQFFHRSTLLNRKFVFNSMILRVQISIVVFYSLATAHFCSFLHQLIMDHELHILDDVVQLYIISSNLDLDEL